jgi:hypothetical protein
VITSVATVPLSIARQFLGTRLPDDHPFARSKRAWVGFDTNGSDVSPLRRVFDGPRLVVRCQDWDIDGRDSEEHAVGVRPEDAPSLAIASEIVSFLSEINESKTEYVLVVHCHAGLWRSGAVAEFARVDLGVRELETSHRLGAKMIGATSDERVFNVTLLRLMREAASGATRETRTSG